MSSNAFVAAIYNYALACLLSITRIGHCFCRGVRAAVKAFRTRTLIAIVRAAQNRIIFELGIISNLVQGYLMLIGE
jgi:hypothetical protein